MARDWQELTRLTGGAPIIVERVRLPDSKVSLEGEFDLPPLARLSAEDQVFVMAFVRSHGSIKEMERIFGISYPTVKNRLNRISGNFDLVEVEEAPPQAVDGDEKSERSEVLAELERAEISVAEAIERLSR